MSARERAAGLRRIVVGVDGSEQSKWALRWAARLADETTEIDAVAAWEFPATYGMAWGMEDWRLDVDAGKVLEAALDEVFGTDRPPHLKTVVREGQPAVVLLGACGQADLLIVGSRGHGGFTGVLLGSVSARCAEHARCAVLVVHQPPPDAG